MSKLLIFKLSKYTLLGYLSIVVLVSAFSFIAPQTQICPESIGTQFNCRNTEFSGIDFLFFFVGFEYEQNMGDRLYLSVAASPSTARLFNSYGIKIYGSIDIRSEATLTRQKEWSEYVFLRNNIIANGTIDEFEAWLVDGDAKLLHQETSGATMLHFAASNIKEPLIAKKLIGFGIDTNKQDVNGWTPLHHAINVNNLAVTRLLLQNGADTSIENQQELSSLAVCEKTLGGKPDHETCRFVVANAGI